MALVGRAASKVAKQRAKNINRIRANREASANALFFGNSRQGQEAMDIAMGRQTHRGWTPAEQKRMAADKAKAQQVVNRNQQYFDDVKGRLREASPEDRNVLRAEARERFSEMRAAQETLNFDPKGGAAYSTMDRVMAGGRAVAQYYTGGSATQNIARIGGTAGVIYGANVGMDYLNSRGGGSSGSGY